jgi:hypothetical protein
LVLSLRTRLISPETGWLRLMLRPKLMDTCTSSRSTGSLSLTQGLSLTPATAGGVSLHHHLLLLHLHVIAGGATTKMAQMTMSQLLAQMTTSQLLAQMTTSQLLAQITTSQLLAQMTTTFRNLSLPLHLHLHLHLQIMTPEFLRITTPPANRGR